MLDYFAKHQTFPPQPKKTTTAIIDADSGNGSSSTSAPASSSSSSDGGTTTTGEQEVDRYKLHAYAELEALGAFGFSMVMYGIFGYLAYQLLCYSFYYRVVVVGGAVLYYVISKYLGGLDGIELNQFEKRRKLLGID